MIKRLLLALALLANHALLADQAKAQEPNVTLTVTQAELTIIGDALGAIPYVKVAPLMAKLQAQVIKQQMPAQPQGSPVAVPENGK